MLHVLTSSHSFVWAMTTLVLNRALLNILKNTANAQSDGLDRVLPSSNVFVERTTSRALHPHRSMDKDYEREAYELQEAVT